MWFNSHPGHFLTWERPLDASSGVTPRYSSTTNSQLTASSLYRYKCNEHLCILLQVLQSVGGGLSVTLGVSGHLSTAISILCHLHNSIRALLCHQPKGLGKHAEESCSDIAFLLVSTQVGGCRRQDIWSLYSAWVNSHQARVPAVEEVVKQVTMPWSPVDPIGLMPWCSSMGTPAHMHHFLGRGTGASCQKEMPAGPPVRRVSQLQVHQLLCIQIPK